MQHTMTKEATKTVEHGLNLFKLKTKPTTFSTFYQHMMIKTDKKSGASRCNSKTSCSTI